MGFERYHVPPQRPSVAPERSFQSRRNCAPNSIGCKETMARFRRRVSCSTVECPRGHGDGRTPDDSRHSPCQPVSLRKTTRGRSDRRGPSPSLPPITRVESCGVESAQQNRRSVGHCARERHGRSPVVFGAADCVLIVSPNTSFTPPQCPTTATGGGYGEHPRGDGARGRAGNRGPTALERQPAGVTKRSFT